MFLFSNIFLNDALSSGFSIISGQILTCPLFCKINRCLKINPAFPWPVSTSFRFAILIIRHTFFANLCIPSSQVGQILIRAIDFRLLTYYSCRSAMIGSTLAARIAGYKPKTSPITKLITKGSAMLAGVITVGMPAK